MAADYRSLGEISLEALKERIDAFDKRIKFMLEEGSRFRGYKTPSAAPSIGYRVVAYITVYEQTPRGPVIGEVNGFPIYAPDFYQIFERFDMAHYVNVLGVKRFGYGWAELRLIFRVMTHGSISLKISEIGGNPTCQVL